MPYLHLVLARWLGNWTRTPSLPRPSFVFTKLAARPAQANEFVTQLDSLMDHEGADDGSALETKLLL